MQLSAIEARVLGSLMEKARTTPDIYPLTLNSLVTACNQKTSRDPVTDYDEDQVLAALDSLREKRLVMRVDMAGARTAKFRENIGEAWELEREEYALLAILLLRGPQTPGQLRQRSDRLHAFAELPQVSDWLHRMQQRTDEPGPLVQTLGRLPGTKEIRYAHTLCPPPEGAHGPDAAGDDADAHVTPAQAPVEGPSREELLERISRLEERLAVVEKWMHDFNS